MGKILHYQIFFKILLTLRIPQPLWHLHLVFAGLIPQTPSARSGCISHKISLGRETTCGIKIIVFYYDKKKEQFKVRTYVFPSDNILDHSC